MNIYIPIADVTLTDGQTYVGQLPLWATRPLMVKVTTGTNEPINIIMREGGAIRKTVSLPYQQYGVDVDLSFAAPLIRRADRNVSEGTPWFPQQLIEFWSTDIATRIIIPVFHCDETYWDTLGVDAALPQPAKPRIPGQTLDIYFPYSIHPSDAFSVEVEPVTGAPSSEIFPTTYVLGNTIDIKYVKKLTIKNVWGSGLDQVINYEDRLMSDAVYDESLQCALRARWNMRNGQWFWAAFKDYFWSNKFTPIRGRGGVTEQAEITINLEYGEEWYNVYQELLVSSNVVFDLNIPGINQYQSKRFRAEVSGDTGARWSNSTKTYRQQVRFRTTELQDNYMFPLAPDNPPTPSIAFSAQRNPWTIGAAYAEGLTNSIYSNAAWEVQSKPSWFSFGDMITLTAADFEQGGLLSTTGMNYEDSKFDSSVYIRLKNLIPIYGMQMQVRSFIPGYSMAIFSYGSDLKVIGAQTIATDANVSTTVYASSGTVAFVSIRLSKVPSSPIAPSEATAAQIGVSDNSIYTRIGKAGTQYIYGAITPNTGGARSGNIVLKSKAGSATYNITVMQAGVSGNILVDTPTIAAGYVNLPVSINVISVGTWLIFQRDSWITPNLFAGANGTTTVTLTIADNDQSNAARTGTITFRNDVTGEIAVVTVNQGGVPTSISVTPSRVSGPKEGATSAPTTCVSSNSWTVTSAPGWVFVAPGSGSSGSGIIGVGFDQPNNTGAKRSGYLRIKNTVTNEIAICLITQEG
ncbi:hypothetical protein BK687P5_00034 [Bacteroides phage BK687P5]|nr:hypothetical protein BK687P5_00034 [Bacteroides phage BK687P5]